VEEKKKAPAKKRAPAKKATKRKAPAKKKRKKKDPNAPKRPLTAYMNFVKDKRPEFQKKHEGMKFGDLSKKIAAAWKNLPDEDKEPFNKAHTKDKERYEKEMKLYKPPESSSSSDSSSDSGDKKKGKKRKPPKKRQKKDPNAPKQATNAYMYFQKQNREKTMKEYPELKSLPEQAKKMGALWQKMNSEERKPYDELAAADKERYLKEKEEYEKKDDEK